jgi:peptidoglycan/xylan/chitin deacetylase (PgdA/CDA1 family)
LAGVASESESPPHASISTVQRLKRLAKRAVHASGLVRLALRWRSGRPLILMYHGVTTREPSGLENLDGKHVGVQRFAEQLRLIKEHRRVVPLRELVDGVIEGRDIRNTVAITFDDGYENNASQAAPVLSDMRLPATFFLATGYIGSDRWMWVDRLEYTLDRTSRRSIQVEGLGPVSLEDKRAALRTIKTSAKRRPQEELAALMAEVCAQCSVDAAAPEGDYRFMTWDQARALGAAGFEIGAHTVNHPILSRVPFDEGEREILQSRDRVREEVGVCSDVFCYPNGKASDYTPAIMGSAARHFHAALATNPGAARVSERYELRRLGIGYATTPADLAQLLLLER